ncbi:hypothetical protein [Mycobacterium sp. 48b]|uniref:hypothetical protein n=1 Tax=Mycobacterium sp. 48b TaxID=3400426 RepID=UPI003AAA2D29
MGKDDIELIATEVFPRDTFRSPRETVASLSEAIDRIHRAGLIARYEADGEKLLYVDKWKDLQRIDRPSKGRYPRPDGTFEYADVVDRESYRNPRSTLASPRDTLATGTGEQGNRGTAKERENARPRGTLALIPDDWEPNLTHRAKAKTLGIKDINAAAEAFRNHALSEARQSANWDAAFASWLASPKTRAAERDQAAVNGHRPATSDLRAAQAQALKDNPPNRSELT